MSCFITGTDTGVGKTLVTVALLRALQRLGLHSIGMKPIATGGIHRNGRFVNTDAEDLLACAETALDYADVNPVLFAAPTAPSIAAAQEARMVDLAAIQAAYKRCAQHADIVLVEGLGGWQVPLGRDLWLVDMVRALELPVLLVAGIRLGAINHAVLSVRAIEQDEIPLIGWIANYCDPDYAYAEETVAALTATIRAPLLGIFPWQSEPNTATMTPDLLSAAGKLAAMCVPQKG